MAHFARQNLQDRSFRDQDLQGADFRNADVRGCDFSRAKLIGADFTGAKLGLSFRQKLLLTLFASAVAIGMVDLVSRFVFNTIPQNPLDPKAAYIQVLVGVLSAAGLTCAASSYWRTTRVGRWLLVLTGILCGALAGFAIAFFYPTFLSHYVDRRAIYFSDATLAQLGQIAQFLTQHKIAIAQQGAISGAVLLLLLSRFRHRSAYKIGVAIAGAIASYGATFILGAFAFVLLGAQDVAWGLTLLLVMLLHLWLTTLSLFRAVEECCTATGTSFCAADLTDAKLDDTRNADFSKAIGYSPKI